MFPTNYIREAWTGLRGLPVAVPMRVQSGEAGRPSPRGGSWAPRPGIRRVLPSVATGELSSSEKRVMLNELNYRRAHAR
jgi:hypothetical protein